MEVFRITLKKWSDTLQPSGYAARWNSNGNFMLYTSSSRALSTLENIVHRSGEGLNKSFKCMVIRVPDEITLLDIKLDDLREDWYKYKNYKYSQTLGDKWIKEGKSAIMRIPSAIIKKESNYLLNPRHPDFSKIKIISIEDFDFDPRIAKS